MHFNIKKKLFLVTALLVILFVVGGYYAQHHAFFEPFRKKVQVKKFSSIQTSKTKTKLAPTVLPPQITPYVTDIKLCENRPVDLKQLIPDLVTKNNNMLVDSKFQIQVGDKNGIYDLFVFWDADSDAADLEVLLFDDYFRPVKALKNNKGKIHAPINIRGGYYELSLTCKGKLGDNYQLYIHALERKFKRKGSLVEESVSALKIKMPLSVEKEWEWMLEVARKKLKNASGPPGHYVPNNSVRSDLIYQDSKSIVVISLSGIGDLGHFSQEDPSFTMQIVSGPLIEGMAKFKLYNIKNKEGLLDYVVTSLMRDEGIFIPQWHIVRLYLNDRYLGIYFMEERYTPEYFEKSDRYEGEVHAFTHHIPDSFYKPRLPSIYYTSKNPPAYLPEITPFYIDSFVDNIDKVKFAKSLALVTRFHCSHGLNHADFRYYRNPLLGEFEPIIRDTDCDLWGEDPLNGNSYGSNVISSFLSHTHWWFGKRTSGIGTTYNVKVYPNPNITGPMTAYYATPVSLGHSDLSQGIAQFLTHPDNREIFERFLFYFSSKQFRDRFLKRLQSTFDAVDPYLEDDKDWVQQQILGKMGKEFQVPNGIPYLVNRSYILVITDNNSLNSEPKSNVQPFLLYNLSPFSMRIELPEYASLEVPSSILPDKLKLTNLYFAPSIFYPMIDTAELTKENGMRLMQIEQLRYFSNNSAAISESGSPIFKVLVPKNKTEDFVEFIKAKSNKILGATYPLQSDNVIVDWELPDNAKSDKKSELYFYSTKFMNERYELAEKLMGSMPSKLVIYPTDVIPTNEGYLLRFLLLNNSLEDLEIDLSRINPSFGMPKCKFECTVDDSSSFDIQKRSKISAWSIFDNLAEPFTQKLILGASQKIESHRSPFLWVDIFRVVMNGTKHALRPNVAMLQIEIPTDNQILYYIMDPNIIKDAVSSENDLQIVSHEYCVNVLHPHAYHKNWNKKDIANSSRKTPIDDTLLKVIHNPDTAIKEVKFKGKLNLISSLLIIPEGYVLVIEPGTTLQFGKNGGILSFGAIKAVGTKGEPIILKHSGLSSDWKGVSIVKTSGENILKHVKISNARGGRMGQYYFPAGLSVLESCIKMDHVEVEDSSADDAVYLYKSWFTISNLKILNVKDDGLDIDWGFGNISDSTFKSTGGDCLDLSGSYASVDKCNFECANDKGVSIGEASAADITRSNFSNNKIGIAIKDQSKVLVKKCYLAGHKVGIAVYLKKLHYIYPSVDIQECNYSDNMTNTVYEPSDSITGKYD